MALVEGQLYGHLASSLPLPEELCFLIITTSCYSEWLYSYLEVIKASFTHFSKAEKSPACGESGVHSTLQKALKARTLTELKGNHSDQAISGPFYWASPSFMWAIQYSKHRTSLLRAFPLGLLFEALSATVISSFPAICAEAALGCCCCCPWNMKASEQPFCVSVSAAWMVTGGLAQVCSALGATKQCQSPTIRGQQRQPHKVDFTGTAASPLWLADCSGQKWEGQPAVLHSQE